MTPVGMNPAVTPTFGRLTASQPRGISNNTNLNFINMVSTSATPQAGSGGPGQLDASTASDYAGIRANIEPQGNRGILGKIADMIVGHKISSAQNA